MSSQNNKQGLGFKIFIIALLLAAGAVLLTRVSNLLSYLYGQFFTETEMKVETTRPEPASEKTH